MTTFDQREEAFEKRFVHDEELVFRAHARRNQKLGAWAAGLLGRQGQDAADYAQGLVAIEVNGGSAEAIVQRLAADFAAGGITRSEHQIRRQMDDFLVQAQQEVRAG